MKIILKRRNKQNIIIVLLLVILSLLVLPYILKLPTQITQVYKQFKETRLKEQKKKEAIRIGNENQRRKSILKKYLITTLEEYYPCHSIPDRCVFEIKIPDIIIKYYFAELKDKKLNRVTYCRRNRDDKYSKYCPDEIAGICPIDLSKIESINRAAKNSPPPTLTQQQVQLNSFIEDLHQKGYSGQTEGDLGFYNYEYYSDNKCGRLNLINESSVIQNFQIEHPTIKKMVEENINESFIQEFSNKSLKNYEVLINEVQDGMSPDLDDYFELNMQTIQNEFITDITGDGNPEKIYITIGKGCGSCHQKFIYIFSGKSKLFEITGDDSQVNALPSGKGFTIKQPIRKDNEPLCCPSEYKTDTYIWTNNTFVKQ